MTISPPGGGEVFHVDLKLSDFEGPGKLDPALLKTIAITDMTVMGGGAPQQSNTIWFGKVDASR